VILAFSIGGGSQFDEWTRLLLLTSCGEQNLSAGGRDSLAVLRSKFVAEDTSLPPRIDASAAHVGSPIPHSETRNFTDDQWLAAMRQYNFGWEVLSLRLFEGSAVELSRLVQSQAMFERRRFAALTGQMDDAIRAEYFDAILYGICDLGNLGAKDRQANIAEFERLDTDLILSVLHRLHDLPTSPCGRSICLAFEGIAERAIPEAELRILVHYALNDPDPASDPSLGHGDPSEHAYIYGYNSVRGAAAHAIERLLFADISRAKILLPVIREMVHDQSPAVRNCVIGALLPVLNIDRGEAVQLFKAACEGADIVFGAQPFEEFVRHASSTHYADCRELLQRACRSTSDAAVRAAARQICLAGFGDETAEVDAETVRGGMKESMRLGAADVYASNVSHGTVGAICRKHLPSLFADQSDTVRATAADCFSHLGSNSPSEFSDLISTYIESPAFPSLHDDLLRCLDHSSWQLPQITIRLAERFVAAAGSSAGDIATAAAADAPVVSKLVVRLYVQTSDESLQSKCLDLIDEMERFGFFGIDEQLAEHDR
jgi:hypothetical protein